MDLPGFPEVESFLAFMLAGAMVQSILLAGNSGAIALALDIEMGFTDRLFAAPISRFGVVLGRLGGTAVLGAFTAVWFLAIGLIFGVTIEEGVLGALWIIAAGRRLGARLRRHRRLDRALQRQGERRPGAVPARLRRALPLHARSSRRT